MIRYYKIGEPIETGSTVMSVPQEEMQLPGWQYDFDKKQISRGLSPDSVVYGLGETVRGMNKKGWLYVSNNTDDPVHTEGKHSLYASQNFILYADGDEKFGLFIDTPGKVCFDIGYTDMRQFSIGFEDMDAGLYLIEDESLPGIAKEFRRLTGHSYIPPKWAFGYGQSRWSYMNADEVRDVVKAYRENHMPLDMVYLDIDYMDHYKDFTVNEDAFPHFSEFVEEMKEEGIHLVPIIDAGVKIEKGYEVYEEGLEKGYFCKKEDGTELVAAVWPGKVHFPDFLNDEARKWFGDWYGVLLRQGIDGFWNDMNEPAIFYTEDHLGEVFRQIEDYKDKNLDIRSFFAFQDLVGSVANHPSDYKRFFHEYQGQRIRHDKVHNLYGYYMTRAAGEAFERLSPEKRILLFSRSSYAGMHRYGGVWTGDNCSWWSHLLLNIQQMPGLNMCGFLYSGADTGGFGDDCTEDLLLRWTAFSLFTPLFRNHSAQGTRRQEPYLYGSTEDFRNLLSIRYALLPYIYSEFMKAALEDGMYMMPLSFGYPQDQRARKVEDQLLVGESLMIAPVYVQNAAGRYVYLPEDMKMIRMRSPEDFEEEILQKGDHYIPAALNEVVFFLRPGHALPLAGAAETVGQIDYGTLRYITYRAEADSYELYNDNGVDRI